MPRVIVYSHGFGVEQDDRGLFTDIAKVLMDTQHIMFDYNQIDANHHTLTVASLVQQKMHLAQVLDEIKLHYPNADIDLICHSQGCVVAALLNPSGIRDTIYIAPPSLLSVEQMLEIFGNRQGAKVDVNGLTTFPRRDGSTTIVPSDYWHSIENLNLVDLYNQFAQQTTLTIIKADNDEVLGATDFSLLTPDIKLITLSANHDFTNNRDELTDIIKQLI